MQLSENFTLEEATRSQTAARMGIRNQPDAVQLANMKRAAVKMEKVHHIGGDAIIDVSSWLRVLPLNRAIGSSDTSAHTKGLAIDCTRRGWTPRKFAEALVPHVKELGIDQLIYEYDSWVHLGFSEGAPRHEVWTIRTGTGYMKGIC